MKLFVYLIIIFTALSTTGRAEKIVSIKSGTYFGECVGYCQTSLEITEREVVYTEYSTDKSKAPRTYRRNTTPDEWTQILKSVSLNHFFTLPQVIGSPDGADEGGETFEVMTDVSDKKTTISLNTNIAGMEDYLKIIRKMRSEMHEKLIHNGPAPTNRD
jgi:hypothetical protein